MFLLVLAYPEMKAEDYKWVQSLRKKFDERYYNVVEPHFTIVFPVEKIEEHSFVQHVKKSTKYFESINFTIRSSIIVKDAFSKFTDVFLVPDEGNSEIIRLHDKMYTGILSAELRLDIPFIPHIGIGGSKIAEECREISCAINKNRFSVNGVLKSLDIVFYNYPKLETIKKIECMDI